MTNSLFDINKVLTNPTAITGKFNKPTSSELQTDNYLAYNFVKLLTTPFQNWPAFALGIIDKDGQVLRKKGTFINQNDQNAWGYYQILICNLKKLLPRLAGGQTKSGVLLASNLLLKEEIADPNNIDEIKRILNRLVFNEDAAVNAVGGGNIAGAGVGPQGEPGMSKKGMRKYKKANQLPTTSLLQRRKAPTGE